MKKTIEELRAIATKILETENYTDVILGDWGNNIKDLLQELNIYHIELEHQNNELERSELELAASRDEYYELFENAPMGYVLIDDSHIIRKVNRTFINLFVPLQERNDSLEGRSFDEFVCPEFQNVFYVFCKMLCKSGVLLPIEIKLRDRFNNQRYVTITAGERKLDSKIFRLAISDIFMQKKLEMQLIQAKERAEENDRQKSLFLTSVSHELRTPLMTMIGFSELLENPKLDRVTQNEYIDSICAAGKAMMNLTDEVLDLSVLESGSMPLCGSNTNVARMCDELAILIQRRFQEKNVLIRSEAEDIPILWADQIRLRQAVFSVLEHAAGNAAEGTVVIQCHFVQNDDYDGVLVMNISGQNIFSGESSLEMDIRRKPVSQNCTGLGLFLAKQIIKAMQGNMIWVHPLDCLSIEIPLKISQYPEVKKEVVKPSVKVNHPHRTCLLVDDIVMNLKVLGAMVKKMNCTPTLANSAKEALDLLGKNHYDFIMTDLWMPDMSGEELAAIIRQNPNYDNIPIYAITADVVWEGNFEVEFFENAIIKPVNAAKIESLFAEMDAKAYLKNK